MSSVPSRKVLSNSTVHTTLRYLWSSVSFPFRILGLYLISSVGPSGRPWSRTQPVSLSRASAQIGNDLSPRIVRRLEGSSVGPSGAPLLVFHLRVLTKTALIYPCKNVFQRSGPKRHSWDKLSTYISRSEVQSYFRLNCCVLKQSDSIGCWIRYFKFAWVDGVTKMVDYLIQKLAPC